MAISYLDVDDEITTAVARLRDSADYRIALFLPAGSRVATSRINFRLLAREAQNHQRRLAIVSPEPAVRAIAVTAGLPAYATVQAYEDALGDEIAAARGAGDWYVEEAAREGESGSSGGPASGEPGGPRAGGGAMPSGEAGPRAGASARGGGPGEAGRAPGGPGTSGGPRAPGVGGRAGGPETGGAGEAARDAGAGDGTPGPESGESRAGGIPRGRSAGALPVVKGEARPGPRRGPSRRGVALLVIVLVLVVAGGAGAYFVLPSATITVTPVAQAVGPISLEVSADPSATAVDPAAAVVPATSVSVPLTVQASFPATGVKVTQTTATGTVVFSSFNTAATVPVPAGTTVSTTSGIDFATTSAITVPKASIKGTTITPGQASAPVKAAAPGPDGNVAAGTITVVSASLAGQLVTTDRPPVDNPDATSGGKRTETKEVSQKDYDGAVQSLTSQLTSQLQAASTAPGTAPAGLTLVPATASLGSVAAGDPASAVVGKAEPSFDLSASASATVLGVDDSQVTSLGQARLESAVTPGDRLFADSVNVSVGKPAVNDGKVTIAVQASGEEWRPVAATDLLPQVKGKSVSEARTILAPYGTVKIQTWPGWVDTIPSLDARVQLVVTSPQRSTP